ncbi:MAG: hypothetical protein AABY22_04970 [Nanoarchaeota archaeon]
MNIKRNVSGFLEIIFRMFLLISGFTVLDMFYHLMYEKNFGLYQVHVSYYINKILWGVILAILAYYIINYMLKWTKYSYKKNFIFSLIIVVPLQINYYLKGHFNPVQNIVIIFAHYFMIQTLLYLYYQVYDMDYIG